HGIAQVPEFSSALFRELAPQGFETLALEIGPSTAAELQRIVNSSAPSAQISSHEKRYPFSLAFYNMAEEFDFLKSARQSAGGHIHIIGIDQELMGASRLILESLLQSHKSDESSRLLRLLLAKDDLAYKEAEKTGRPDLLLMMSVDPNDLTKLGAQLAKDR